jgi:hypothetical protein
MRFHINKHKGGDPMLQLGKRLFVNNPIQVLIILTSFALALLVLKLPSNMIHLSLYQFISARTDTINPAEVNFNFILGVTLPSLFFILSSSLLIWLGIINLILFSREKIKINVIPRFILAIIQISLFILFIYMGGKVFFYFSLFVVIVFVMGGFILSGLAVEER